MKATILKTTFSVSLVIATIAGATNVYAKGNMQEELNLTDEQVAQLEQYRESKKAERTQRSEAQKEADKAVLSEFLTDEQVEAIMSKKDKGDRKGGMKKGGKNLLNHAEELELTENQIVQIQTIIDEQKAQRETAKEEGSEKPSKEEMKASREALKAQIQAVLTDAQVEKLDGLRSK